MIRWAAVAAFVAVVLGLVTTSAPALSYNYDSPAPVIASAQHGPTVATTLSARQRTTARFARSTLQRA